MVVLPNADVELDNVKRAYDGIEPMLSEVARSIARRAEVNLLHEINVIFFPQIGFLISVSEDLDAETNTYNGDENDPWERMFATE